MKVRVSPAEIGRRRTRRGGRVSDERGAVLVLVAGGMVVLLAMAGFALDSGRAYLLRSRLSRAVDAGSLAGARALRLGRAVATREAVAVAKANGAIDGERGLRLDMEFGFTADGERTVSLTARRPLRTLLMRLVGPEQLDVAATATAVAPPIDLVLVIDQSHSLELNGAWDDLQEAAKEFVGYFDDDYDRMGLVSFSTAAAERVPLEHGFSGDVRSRIDAMSSAGWTNTAAGLALAYGQIAAAEVRPGAARVVVFFTDGRPTAFRGLVGGKDRILAAKSGINPAEAPNVAGYFDDPDHVPTDRYPPRPYPCDNVTFCKEWKEGGRPPHGPAAREIARARGAREADRIRDAGIYVYTIGLGNPNAASELARPDRDYLNLLANEDGIADPGQPRGESYFAPSARELGAVFRRVAADLVVRLSR